MPESQVSSGNTPLNPLWMHNLEEKDVQHLVDVGHLKG